MTGCSPATKEGISLDRTPNAPDANGFYRPDMD